MTTRNKFSPEVREREVRMVELKCELSLWPAPTRCIASIAMRPQGHRRADRRTCTRNRTGTATWKSIAKRYTQLFLRPAEDAARH